MDKKELEQKLKSNPQINSALFFGACDYLAELYANRLLETAQDGADVLKLYFDEYSFSEAKNFLSQNSLFGDKLVLIVKSDKKIPKTDVKELIAIAHKNDALFIFRFFGDMSAKDKDYYELFGQEKNALFVRFFNPNSMGEAIGYLRAAAQKRALEIDDAALDRLLSLKNMDLESSVKELEKLGALDQKIGTKEVALLVDESDDMELEKLFENILEKKEFYRGLSKILEKAEFDEIRVVLSFGYYIQELFMFLLYSKAYGSYDAKKITGRALPDFVARAKATKAVRIKYQSYVKIFEILLELDLSLKTSKNVDKKAILLQGLIKLQNNL